MYWGSIGIMEKYVETAKMGYIGITCLGVPVARIEMFWCLYCILPISGHYHLLRLWARNVGSPCNPYIAPGSES